MDCQYLKPYHPFVHRTQGMEGGKEVEELKVGDKVLSRVMVESETPGTQPTFCTAAGANSGWGLF